MFVCFYRIMILVGKTLGKKLDENLSQEW